MVEVTQMCECTLLHTSANPPATAGPAAYPNTKESSSKACKYKEADTLTYCKQWDVGLPQYG